MIYIKVQLSTIIILLTYQAIATLLDRKHTCPGQRYDIGGYKLHLHCQGTATSTVIIDSSLGGLEGYLLIDALSEFTTVYIYDRAGYGWSDRSPYPRTSRQVVKELDALLTQANVAPPYILVGDSFGSYNMRLYAHTYPTKVQGLVLTDGLHESGMLHMPLSLSLLKLLFISGFVMSTAGASLGIVRLLAACRAFEYLKPQLRKFKPRAIAPIKRSFIQPKHWLTMTREMISLNASGRQLATAKDLGDLPIISIKSASFFTPTLWTHLTPLRTINRLRDRMHQNLLNLSGNSRQI